VEAHPFW